MKTTMIILYFKNVNLLIKVLIVIYSKNVSRSKTLRKAWIFINLYLFIVLPSFIFKRLSIIFLFNLDPKHAMNVENLSQFAFEDLI